MSSVTATYLRYCVRRLCPWVTQDPTDPDRAKFHDQLCEGVQAAAPCRAHDEDVKIRRGGMQTAAAGEGRECCGGNEVREVDGGVDAR